MKPRRSNSEDSISPKRRKTDMQSQKYVPDDITIQILARLPVKSLLRFSSVSKTWNALFRTPKLISEHHQMYNSNQNSNFSDDFSHLVYMRPGEKENDAQTICTVLGERDGLEKSNFVLPFSRYVVAGYCEGLILIRLGKESDFLHYIWNPLVGILKSIGGGGVQTLHRYTVALGFGYAGRSGDYRVLKMTYTILGPRWLHEVEIYSLAADRWTRIERYCDRPPLWGHMFSSNVFFKGSIYFVAKSVEGIEKYIIVRFDLDEEVFSEIALPPYKRPDIRLWQLAVVGGDMLALLHAEDRDDEKLHISAWLLNKESTSWTAQTHHFDLPKALFFVYITGAGHIVMEERTTPGVRQRLFIHAYNANHHEFKLTNLQTSHIAPGEFSFFPSNKESSLTPINKESLFFLDRSGE